MSSAEISTADTSRRRRRLSLAAWMIAAGLVIELVSLIWSHPTAFLLFLAPGAVLVAVGVAAFLWEIATNPAPVERDEPAPAAKAAD